MIMFPNRLYRDVFMLTTPLPTIILQLILQSSCISAAHRQVLGMPHVTNAESGWMGGHLSCSKYHSTLCYPLRGRETPSSGAEKDYLEMMLLGLYFFVANQASLISWVVNVVPFTNHWGSTIAPLSLDLTYLVSTLTSSERFLWTPHTRSGLSL